MRIALPLVVSSLFFAFAACSDDGGGSTPTDGGTTDGGTVPPGTDAGPTDAGLASCDAAGRACVDAVASVTTSIAFDGTSHPVVAYASAGGISVKRWNDTNWEAVGAVIGGRDTSIGVGFQLHFVAGKLHLVSREGTGNIHVQAFDGAAWADVSGSPITVPAGASSGSTTMLFDSAAKSDVLHVIITTDGGIDPFHVRKWDGTTLAAETEATGAASSKASHAHLSVASDGSIATAYGSGQTFITKNVTGSTDWTLGTGAQASTNENLAFRWTPGKGYIAYAVGAKMMAASGDGATWTTLADVDVSTFLVGYPAMLVDAAEQPIVVYTNIPTADASFRAKRWDGAAWQLVGDSPAVTAPGFSPPTTSAALHDKTIGIAGTRRFGDLTTSYIRYEELVIP